MHFSSQRATNSFLIKSSIKRVLEVEASAGLL